MAQSSVDIVGDVPAVNVRHDIRHAGEWSLMASRYTPSDRYPAEHVDLSAWNLDRGTRVGMSMSLPTAAMRALYNALGAVLAEDERCPSCGEVSATYVPCSGCGLRNYSTTNPTWNCPDFPTCAETLILSDIEP